MLAAVSVLSIHLRGRERSRQPWRCLCLGFEQITMTRPLRRITLQLSQICLTLGWTFIAFLRVLVVVNNAANTPQIAAIRAVCGAAIVLLVAVDDPASG